VIPTDLAEHLGTLLPGGDPDWPIEILESQSIGGGCIHHATRIRTEEGQYFLKYNHAREADNFAKEWRGLNLLASAKALKVPEALATGKVGSHAFLLTEYIEEGSRSTVFWTDFGRGLAALHRNSKEQYGLNFDNYIGALPQHNEKRGDWISFFIEQRLEKQLRLAMDNKKADLKLKGSLHALYKKLPQLLPEEPASLLHGDLWSGNFLCATNGEAVLIDPAVYYGHREAELAFTHLFGGFRQGFYDAYQEAWPLQTGWEDRIDLFNLYPLMVHLNLFGHSYLPQIQSILSRFV